jgi:hypothetical protein
MGLKLPRRFVDVELADLFEYTLIADELSELNADTEGKAYYDGMHDCMAMLFGDLTHQPTITRCTELARIFENFRMENRLLRMEQEINERDLG